MIQNNSLVVRKAKGFAQDFFDRIEGSGQSEASRFLKACALHYLLFQEVDLRLSFLSHFEKEFTRLVKEHEASCKNQDGSCIISASHAEIEMLLDQERRQLTGSSSPQKSQTAQVQADETKAKVQDLVEKAKLSKALDLLCAYFKATQPDEDNLHSVLVLKQRLSQIRSSGINGTASHDETRREQNAISYSILELSNEIER